MLNLLFYVRVVLCFAFLALAVASFSPIAANDFERLDMRLGSLLSLVLCYVLHNLAVIVRNSAR